jgi:hypothetical protein
VVTTAPDLAAPAGRFAVLPHRAARSWPLEALLLVLLAAATALIYCAIHRRLAIDANVAFARLHPFGALTHPGRDSVVFSLGPFLAVLSGSIVLAALRHRFAAFGIFALTAFTTVSQSVLGVLPADRGFSSRVGPNPLGGFWTNANTRPEIGQLWRGFAIDYSLALLPAIAIVVWTLHAEPRTRIRVRVPTRSEAAGLACSVFLFWLALHTWELREALRDAPGLSIGTDVVAYFPFFLLGIALARGPHWRFLAAAGVPILWATTWIPLLLVGDSRSLDMSELHDALPYLAVVTAGLLWHPIASVIDGERAQPWVLVVALNLLNIADLVLTRIALHSGQAVEANPFAAWIGPGVKLVGVGIASALVARFRPRAVIWLVIAFAAVIVWHLSGVVLDTS